MQNSVFSFPEHFIIFFSPKKLIHPFLFFSSVSSRKCFLSFCLEYIPFYSEYQKSLLLEDSFSENYSHHQNSQIDQYREKNNVCLGNTSMFYNQNVEFCMSLFVSLGF